jgi:hypothetical protein
MTWEHLQEYLKGKVFLIGLTFVDSDGKIVEQYQTHGTVTELTNQGLLRFRKKDGSDFQIPYSADSIKKADKGEYKEKSSGLIITDPDFLMTWEITTTDNDNLEEVKKHGFIPSTETD